MPEAIIETAIGLLFVFVLMSLLSSQLVEWFAAYRGWRSRDLEIIIRSMLFDPAIKDKINEGALVLADQLYAHPLIGSLARRGDKPSYIPADKFVLALLDVITTAGMDNSSVTRARVGLEQVKNQLLAALPSAAEPELLSLINQVQQLINQASAGGQLPEMIAALPLPPLLNDELNGFLNRYGISRETFNALIQSVATDSDILVNQILGGAMRLSQYRPELAQIITTLFSSLDTYLAQGETRLAAARKNVERWFNDTMDRASGWYKRHTQLWLGIVGFVLALLLNVDTVAIATTLWRDPTLRQSVIDQAQQYQLPTAANTESTADSIQATPVITNTEQAAQAIRDLSMKLSQDLRLPIGWQIDVYTPQPGETCTLLPLQPGEIWALPNGTTCIRIREAVPNPSAGLVSKLVGLIITAVAVSQGAPFWFDLLQKLVNLRLSGKKPK